MFSLRDLGGIPVCTFGDLVGIPVFPPWHVRRNCMNPHVCALISSQCFGIIVLTLKPSPPYEKVEVCKCSPGR